MSNLTNDQRKAIKEIKSDPDKVVYSYDKGNGFVCINRQDSLNKMYQGIGKSKILKHDPTNTHVKKIQDLLVAINKEINIPKSLYFRLYPSDAIPPRAYGQCKAHKPTKNYPFRVLVSTIGTAPYKISKYLVDIIQPTLSKSTIMIKNSKSFVDEARNWAINPNEIQVSYDVVALYPSIPIKKATVNLINILNEDFEDFKTRTVFNLNHIKQLIEVCLYKSYFVWNGQIHCLEDSGPIGLSLMVILAESFLQTLEKTALTIARSLSPPVAPITHKRYVDDTHDRFNNKEESEEFLKILNEQESRIKFEPEYENANKELNFLDTTVINNNQGHYNFKLFRKDAITNIQIKPNSCHDEKTKIGVFKGYISRARSICSPEYLTEELKFISDVFVENGYSGKYLKNIIKNMDKCHQINRIDKKQYVSLPLLPQLSNKLRKVFKKSGYTVSFKSPSNIKDVLTNSNKDRLPDNSFPGVYMVSCECLAKYVGQTKNSIKKRCKQHEKNVFLGQNEESAISAHANKNNHQIKWENTKTLARETNYVKRSVREALEIKRNKTGPNEELGMNQDHGLLVKTKTWDSLLNQSMVNRRVPPMTNETTAASTSVN